jgi:chromosome partitioning protein
MLCLYNVTQGVFEAMSNAQGKTAVLVVASQKGGTGKSTLLLSLSVAAVEAGHKAMIFDMDEQKSAEKWYQRREKEEPRLLVVKSGELEKAIEVARQKEIDFVFIDTPGKEDPSTIAAIKMADLCIVPCRPTPGDMETMPTTCNTIKRLNKPAIFVLNQSPARGTRAIEAHKGLSMLAPVSPVKIGHRVDFHDAQALGEGVTEHLPKDKAASEIRKLWKWIVSRLERINNDVEEANGTE